MEFKTHFFQANINDGLGFIFAFWFYVIIGIGWCVSSINIVVVFITTACCRKLLRKLILFVLFIADWFFIEKIGE